MGKKIIIMNKQQKRVMFNETPVSTIRSCDDNLSNIERRSLWYQGQEYDLFRKQAKQIVQQLSTCNNETKLGLMNTEEYCARGFEKYLSKDRATRREVQRAFVNSVLILQGEQRKGIFCDPQKHKMLAAACSRRARKVAREIATQDELEAFKHYLPFAGNSTVRALGTPIRKTTFRPSRCA